MEGHSALVQPNTVSHGESFLHEDIYTHIHRNLTYVLRRMVAEVKRAHHTIKYMCLCVLCVCVCACLFVSVCVCV